MMEHQIEMKQDGMVFFKVDDKEYKVPESVWKRYIEGQKKNKINLSLGKENLVSLFNNKIRFNPFQYKPYFKLISNMEKNNNFIFIADEVGVGKTYETGIIISELLYQKKIDLEQKNPILVVCPSILMRKWQEVLLVSFGIPSRIVTKVEDTWGVSIISYDSISVMEAVNNMSIIQLTVFDESHKMTGTNREVNCKKIAKMSKIRILLSATPENGKGNALRLQKEILLQKEEDISFDSDNQFVNRTRKIELREKDICNEVKTIVVENDMAQDLRELGDILLKGNAALYRTIWMNMVISSPKAAEHYIESLTRWLHKPNEIREILKKELEKEIFEELKSELEVEDIEELKSQAQEYADKQISESDVEKIKEKIINIVEKNSRGLYRDTKFEILKGIIDERIEESKAGRINSKYYKKIVVFVKYTDTADFLKENLQAAYKEIFLIDGRLSIDEKQESYEKFKNSEGNSILIITNVACEGLDMDFCNAIVNYDMDYNPVVLEQRRGRIDRFDCPEGKDVNYIYNFVVSGIDPNEEEIQEAACDDEKINKIRELYPYSIYGHILYKLKNIFLNTNCYYSVVDNNKYGSIADDRVVEIKEKAFENIKDIFRTHNCSCKFEEVKKTYQELIEKEIVEAVESKFGGRYSNGIIQIDCENVAILNLLFKGGNIASDRIYQRQ